MKKQEIIDLWNKTLLDKIGYKGDDKPRFKLAETVKITTTEPSLGGWTWMDDIRKERMGQQGIIIDMGYLREHPKEIDGTKISGFSYRIKFKDNDEIVFIEEHLKKVRRKNEKSL